MTEKTTPLKKWGKEDDAKLAELFRRGTRTGGVSALNLNSKEIRKVHENHFPARPFKNFCPLFRSKARAWNINQSLTGARSEFMYLFCLVPCD
jgi:hypothetical protein